MAFATRQRRGDKPGGSARPSPLGLERLEDRTLPSLVAASNFNEPGGAAVVDASGAGNNGTVSGAARVAGGRSGAARSFNGTGDLVYSPRRCLPAPERRQDPRGLGP